MTRRTLMALLLALAAGGAWAQDDKSCTFTYNSFSRKIEQKCQGIPAAPLPDPQILALRTGQVKVCTVEVTRESLTRVKSQPPVCK